jgi:transcriptional regulator GlxA family with amidase domain
MDMALAIIETVFGGERSEEIARQAEYCWNRDPGEDPFAS